MHETNDSSSTGCFAVKAWYGPAPTLATKLVVTVFDPTIGDVDVAMRTWIATSGDIRHDTAIAAEADAFLTEHQVVDAMDSQRIIGCTHEEGIDYPMGRACPRCPAWIGIDRFTQQPIVAAVPTMSPADILLALTTKDDERLDEALASAEAHREALVAPLLAAIDRGVAKPHTDSAADANLFSYALYLVAKWREPRALPAVVRWLSLPEEQPFAIGGDIVTQDGPRILAAVCDGDTAPIDALILNRTADEYGRSAGVNALALLAAWGEIPREPVIEKLRWLAQAGLEREYSQVWDSLASAIVDLEAVEAFPELRRAFDDELIDPQFIEPEEFAESREAADGLRLEELRSGQPPIDDIIEATSWWAEGGDDDWDDAEGNEEDWPTEPQQPYRAPPKVGRNEPCPCGSGKKYKKCCGR